ncbi:MAG: hypothetical protein IPJ88_15920 [Myxococcales bacterium]|nr:MAG: hypothetical protein IPJ88_15920 [Myxococcales bacterium]
MEDFDPKKAQQACAQFSAAGGKLANKQEQTMVAALFEHSPALFPLLCEKPSRLSAIVAEPLSLPWNEESLRSLFDPLFQGELEPSELTKQLRELRHIAMLRLALRDVLRLADIDQSSAEVSALASTVVHYALSASLSSYTKRFGLPLDEQKQPIPLVALGMGKLGGVELNPGSDIDLCFFYGSDHMLENSCSIEAHAFFTKVVQRSCSLISDVSEDGFCFRVDLRLRPEGRTGPLVNSLSSAERYYESWGRNWERAALLRARPIAGDLPFGKKLLLTLKPFVFRREIKPALAGEMMELLDRNRSEHQVDLENDVKLGLGGIREAEFFVQSLQLIWGDVIRRFKSKVPLLPLMLC